MIKAMVCRAFNEVHVAIMPSSRIQEKRLGIDGRRNSVADCAEDGTAAAADF